MQNIKKYFMTLALLLTAVTGAWAEEKMVTINYSTMSSGAVTATGFNILENFLYISKNPATITTSEGVITKLVIKKYDGSFGDAFTEANVGVTPGTITYGSDEITVTDINAESVTLSRKGTDNWSTSSVDVYYGAPAAFPFPITWDATNKTTGFNQPAGNVTMNVEYYPVAELTKAPAAKSDIKAATADAIVTAGTVAMIGQTENAQGTLMYYAVQSETAPEAPDYDNKGWSDKVPTAADFNQGNVYVWYYVKGNDGDAESTFNDGAITKLGESGYVTLAAPPIYAITLAEGTEDVGEWVISPAEATKGQTVTVTYTGSRKVKSVKAVKKGGAPDPKLATPLTIEAITAGFISVSSPKEGMQFSLDGGATKNAVTTGQIVLAAGDKVQFYGNGTSITSYYGTKITGSGNGFTCKVYGNIMSLVDETGFATATTLSESVTFYGLFYGNTTLTDASGLLLPATELTPECYNQMFRSCTSLTAAPELPATELAGHCYRSMFMGCTALTTAPVLPATELVERCYYQMFINCSKLATVTCLATSGINDNSSTTNWLKSAGSQVEGTKTVYTVSTANWPEGDTSGIPTGWTRVKVDN
ncbi:hypothetical protein M1D30_11150 [Prevotella sp. E15-22]|uniref:hypothetical protein n=1 Tax=Prevotella sp. E15-22 TaxID=2937774 RepID=UPI00205E203A|nr:hypothetical protein [Prevotella sp. E15-22]UPS44117.1 hypothetical protein M1D30_11150 [Prevotella sp. E15-22]